MVKIIVDIDNEICECEATGNIIDVLTELTYGVTTIIQNFPLDDEEKQHVVDAIAASIKIFSK